MGRYFCYFVYITTRRRSDIERYGLPEVTTANGLTTCRPPKVCKKKNTSIYGDAVWLEANNLQCYRSNCTSTSGFLMLDRAADKSISDGV